MDGTLVAGWAKFRGWAPGAQAVYVVFDAGTTYKPDPADLLACDVAAGRWT